MTMLGDINDLTTVGLIRDVPGYQLNPEAFTLAENCRYAEGGIAHDLGKVQVFGTPPVAPHFTMPIASTSLTYWLYVSLTKAYVFDGSAHTNITRALGDYTAGATRDWNGLLFGGVPILNNGTDDPQYWSTLAPATPLIKLANWPANFKCAVMRNLGPYLVALNLTKAGVAAPHTIRWSHPADPGTVPSSWDITDPTKDAGEVDLPDTNAGLIREGLGLNGNLMIYKDNSTWTLKFVGGQSILAPTKFLESSGILGPRCVALTGDGLRHVVATQDDVIVHNGNSAESILDRRYKRTLVNQIDLTNFKNSFVYCDPFANEIVFCFPESGSVNPSRALVWQYKEGQVGPLSERTVDYRNVALGTIETATAAKWNNVVGTWASYVGPWSATQRRAVVGCKTDSTKFMQFNSGTQNDGANFTATIQRTGLGLAGRKRNGDWLVDFTKRKFFSRLWLKIKGGPVNVRIAFQELVDGPIFWSPAKTFDPGSQLWIDTEGSGQAIGYEISSTNQFVLEGFKVEGDVMSVF